jgi:hypothetical protein
MRRPSDPATQNAGRFQRIWQRSREIVQGVALMACFVVVAIAWLVVAAVQSWRGKDFPN